MAAITMASLNLIHKKIISDYPQFNFIEGADTQWSPASQTIFYGKIIDSNSLSSLFHELGHALCGHSNFEQDINLLQMEREAWDCATKIALVYGHPLHADTVENALESYRDWLYARSRCPQCHNPGVQSKKTSHYTCLLCATKWRATDARTCGLKRYTE